MLFNSHIFIFVFLPLCLCGWYLLNHFKFYKIATAFLIGMSLWFYGYFNPSYLYIIIGSMLGNYCISFLIEKFPAKRKLFFFIGLIANICLLGYYKYYDFFVENINAVFKSSFALKHILLPLGISFFTLQQISYLIDRYWESAPHYNILDYLAYVAFFPQLIAGPIVLHNEIIPQMQDHSLRKFNAESFRDGWILFIIGLAKKVLIADLFAHPVNLGFQCVDNIDTPSGWIMAICYTFELYFDFSGYCDMACGLGKMFNFELPINFKSPYKSHSVPEYWNRWHFTLTRFFTSYIYTPLTIHGVRVKKRKLYSYLTPMVVFFVSGFWHGASWTFVLWGIAQGLATLWAQRKFFKLKKNFITWFGTFFFIMITQVIFRSETIYNMVRVLKVMFVPSFSRFWLNLVGSFNQVTVVKKLVENTLYLQGTKLYLVYGILWLVCFLIAIFLLIGKNSNEILDAEREKGVKASFALFLGVVLAACLISMTGVSTFLYFNF